jgi:hypothetical protein
LASFMATPLPVRLGLRTLRERLQPVSKPL